MNPELTLGHGLTILTSLIGFATTIWMVSHKFTAQGCRLDHIAGQIAELKASDVLGEEKIEAIHQDMARIREQIIRLQADYENLDREVRKITGG